MVARANTFSHAKRENEDQNVFLENFQMFIACSSQIHGSRTNHHQNQQTIHHWKDLSMHINNMTLIKLNSS
jgi:hypothetical protein